MDEIWEGNPGLVERLTDVPESPEDKEYG